MFKTTKKANTMTVIVHPICSCEHETHTHVCLCITKVNLDEKKCKFCESGDHKLIAKKDLQPKSRFNPSEHFRS